jgi:hypothetical protein
MPASALATLIANTTGCVACWENGTDVKAATVPAIQGAARADVQGANGLGHLSLVNGDYYSIPDVAAIDVGNTFTVGGTFRRSLVHGSNGYTMYSKGASSINFGILGNKLRLRQNSVGDCLLASGDSILDLHKEHIMLARKAGAGERSLWLDGVKVTGLTTDTDRTFADTATAAEVGGGPAAHFGGWVGVVFLFSTAVADADIAIWQAAFTDKMSAATMSVSVNRKYGVHEDLTYFGDSTPSTVLPMARNALRSRISRNSILPHLIRAGAEDPGADSWVQHDSTLLEAKSRGLEVIGTCIGSPEWLNGSADKFVVPGTGGTATDPTADAPYVAWRDAWLEIVGRAVTRYPWITKWECWNEPNEDGFWKQPTAPSARYYADLYLAFRTTVLAANSSAQVGLGALASVGAAAGADITGVSIPALTGFLNQLTISYGITDANTDFVSCHPYEQGTGTGDPAVETVDQNNFQDAQRVYDWLRYKGISAEVWLTEFGWSTATFSQADQATHLGSALAMVRDYWPWVGPVVYFLDYDRAGFSHGLYTSAFVEKTAAATFRNWNATYDNKRTALNLGPVNLSDKTGLSIGSLRLGAP